MHGWKPARKLYPQFENFSMDLLDIWMVHMRGMTGAINTGQLIKNRKKREIP